jgi:hypothetical protein
MSAPALCQPALAGDIKEAKTIEAGLAIYYCTADNQGMCYIGFARLSAPGGKEAGKVKLTRVAGAP